MSNLTSLDQFHVILDFAHGIADRGIPLSVVVLEPDGWPVSPSPVQERALEGLTRDVVGRTRRSDRITRLATARFAALLMDCNRQGALIFADRLTVTAEPFVEASGFTVSCGIATFGPGMAGPGALLDAAQAALKQATAAGGNRIEIHES